MSAGKRFGKISNGARFDGLRERTRVIERSDEYDWRDRAGGCQFLLKIEAGEAGQMDIEHEARGIVGSVGVQEILGGRKSGGAETGGVKEAADGQAHAAVVIDHHHILTVRIHK